MLHTPQINVYVNDAEASVAFFRDHLGFVETFRTPAEGPPDHVELRLEGLVLGFVNVQAARQMHRLDIHTGPHTAEIALWTDDTDATYDRLLAAGATSLSEPHVFLNRLRAAWVADPNGVPVQLVARWLPNEPDVP